MSGPPSMLVTGAAEEIVMVMMMMMLESEDKTNWILSFLAPCLKQSHKQYKSSLVTSKILVNRSTIKVKVHFGILWCTR